MGDPYTYDKAQDQCSQNGGALCSRDQYCIGGKGGSLWDHGHAQGMSDGDKYAPIFAVNSDAENSWIQTGTANGTHKRCWTRTELGYGKPEWGESGLSASYGRMLCCVETTGAYIIRFIFYRFYILIIL